MTFASNYLNQISNLPDLKPSEPVNLLFSKLISDVVNKEIKQNLCTNNLCRLQQYCGKAEFELETNFVEWLLNKTKLQFRDLHEFEYFNNYQELTNWEHEKILIHSNKSPKKILFIGSGPFPLTGILLGQISDYEITLLDRDSSAIKLSKSLIQKLSLQNINIVQNDIRDYQHIADHDVIIVAALVGENEIESVNIINHIFKQANKKTLIIARTTHGEREVLYRKINTDKLLGKPIHQIAPNPQIINSILCLTT
jgi:16S rRNA G527 N7-methylase RsmG